MTSKNTILKILRAHKARLSSLGVKRIGLFGSYARGEQKPQSDIDLLIDFTPELETFDNFINLNDFLEALFAGEKVEVVTVNGLSPHIGRHILAEVDYV